jgi:hypothetical protein
MIAEREVEGELRALDGRALEEMVRRATGREGVQIGEWMARAMNPGWGYESDGLYRVAGKGLDAGQAVDWSVVLKVVEAGDAEPARREVGSPIYWRREVCAYESGLLEGLPGGVRAARCLGVWERSDGECRLWLEDVGDSYGARWPLEQYARAAECLGRFNGAYVVERSVPEYPWLLGDAGASMRGLLRHVAGIREVVADAGTWEHPRLRGVFPGGSRERLLRLWADGSRLLDALDSAPQTFCHCDAWRGNMFAPVGADGQRELVMIDWEFCGRGGLGPDAGDLMAASFHMMRVESADPAALDEVVFESYLKGLRDAGWHGERKAVRKAYAAYAAVKYCSLLLWLWDLDDETRRSGWERKAGHSFDEFVRQQAALVGYLLDMADEVRA